MNKIEELINQLCPDGVVFKELGVLGLFENIGVDKKTIDGQKKVMLLNFMDIMRNKHINKKVLRMEVSASDSKIEKCDIKKHDVFITPTSETRDEIGFAAVVDQDIPNAVYSYHIMRYRLHEKNEVTPYFISYLFETSYLRTQIFKASKGLTRFGLSGKDFGKLTIPFPPLPIQQQIVSILDSFTQLEAELEAELEARARQYEYYREQLLMANDEGLMVNGVQAEWKPLGEIGQFVRGNGLQKKDFTESGVGCIHYGQIYTYYGTYTDKTKSFVSPEFAKKMKKAQKDDLIIATTSENVEDVCKTVVWLGDEEIAISGETCIFKHNQNAKYLAYYLQTPMFLDFKKQNITGTKVIRVHGDKLKKFQIPIPPLAEQEHIVGILDKFDALVNDLSVGLPAEIQARKKQYEYYRGKLLDFKPLTINH